VSLLQYLTARSTPIAATVQTQFDDVDDNNNNTDIDDDDDDVRVVFNVNTLNDASTDDNDADDAYHIHHNATATGAHHFHLLPNQSATPLTYYHFDQHTLPPVAVPSIDFHHYH